MIELDHINVLSLRPGDVLICKSSVNLDNISRRRVHETLAQHFPGHEVIVLPPELTLEVSRKEDL